MLAEQTKELKRGRGRPVTGKAVSATQRNRKYRAKRRLLAAIQDALFAGVDVDQVVWDLHQRAEAEFASRVAGSMMAFNVSRIAVTEINVSGIAATKNEAEHVQ